MGFSCHALSLSLCLCVCVQECVFNAYMHKWERSILYQAMKVLLGPVYTWYLHVCYFEVLNSAVNRILCFVFYKT